MIVEVDVQVCLDSKLTISEFVFLSLLWQKKANTAIELMKNDIGLQKSIPDLHKRGYLIVKDKLWIIDRKKCNLLFGKREDSDFWEFFSTYPMKVSLNGATRVLRAQDPNSKNAIEAMGKYKARVKSKAMHRHVMACLNAELEQKKRSNKLGYMQNIITWLNQQSWQMSEYLLKNEQPKVETKHGEKLI